MSGHGGQPFPLSKLAFMYVKKVAQPIASRIARKAEKDNWFKTYICLPPANLYHFYEAKIKFKVMNIGRTRISKVPKLNEKAAIELGSNLCAEFIIMSVASILALHEVRKYKAREIEVEERLNKETKDLSVFWIPEKMLQPIFLYSLLLVLCIKKNVNLYICLTCYTQNEQHYL
ncbi:putative OPA3-like protein CG13603 isoform X3 [Eurytemora carolleeae]|uniref:putative OPA3-like protein CG13603 isoform X3 n=1 Tax=Eurytemora carolleeae TaxID=1294199 RepID=UPI000C767D23|nr:putative OPA3-like protein CG13603 isoform X3 [Eurytemora carolleeae]|eukprot:XP_023334298.1 putative OPA3-like protein CG13603 isoform X3 [Eurytemora affinis]